MQQNRQFFRKYYYKIRKRKEVKENTLKHDNAKYTCCFIFYPHANINGVYLMLRINSNTRCIAIYTITVTLFLYLL